MQPLRSMNRLFFSVCVSAVAAMLPDSAGAQCSDWRAGPLDDGAAPNGANDDIVALTSWDPDGAGSQPPMLVAGGYFTSIEGVPANGIAARDGTTGQWQALGNGFGDGAAVSLTVYNGDLIAAGYTFPGVGRSELVKRWVPASQAWQVMASADAGIHAITVYNGDLIAAGGFTTIQGVAVATRGRCAYDMNVDGIIDLADLPLIADLLVNDGMN